MEKEEGMVSNLVELGEASQIPKGEMKAFSIDGLGEIAVYHVDDEWFATDDVCSHAVASLTEGWLEGCTVICPAHSGEFDIRSGKALCFPATEPISTYQVWVEGGKLLVNTTPNKNDDTHASSPQCQ